MQNNSAYEYGLRVGSQVRCFKVVTGTKQDGSMWGLINHTEKDSNKNVLQKYNLWLINDSNFIANLPTNQTIDVRIESITSVKPGWNSYEKNGQKFRDRIINLEVTISVVGNVGQNQNYGGYQQNQAPVQNDYNNPYFDNEPTQQPQYQAPQNQYQGNPNSFDVNKKPNYNEPLPKSDEVKQAESFLDIDIEESDLPF